MSGQVEVFDVELIKDNLGLGITIAGYISDKSSGMSSKYYIRIIAQTEISII